MCGCGYLNGRWQVATAQCLLVLGGFLSMGSILDCNFVNLDEKIDFDVGSDETPVSDSFGFYTFEKFSGNRCYWYDANGIPAKEQAEEYYDFVGGAFRFGRIVGSIAAIGGCILFLHSVTMCCSSQIRRVRHFAFFLLSIVLTLFQGLTLVAFHGNFCKENACVFGRAARFSCFASICYCLAGVMYLLMSDYPGVKYFENHSVEKHDHDTLSSGSNEKKENDVFLDEKAPKKMMEAPPRMLLSDREDSQSEFDDLYLDDCLFGDGSIAASMDVDDDDDSIDYERITKKLESISASNKNTNDELVQEDEKTRFEGKVEEEGKKEEKENPYEEAEKFPEDEALDEENEDDSIHANEVSVTGEGETEEESVYLDEEKKESSIETNIREDEEEEDDGEDEYGFATGTSFRAKPNTRSPPLQKRNEEIFVKKKYEEEKEVMMDKTIEIEEHGEDVSEYRAKVVSMVSLILPAGSSKTDADAKVDAMMKRFKGREADLISSLETMQRRTSGVVRRSNTNQSAALMRHTSKASTPRPSPTPAQASPGIAALRQRFEGK